MQIDESKRTGAAENYGRASVCRILGEADGLLVAGRGGEAASLAGRMLKSARTDADLTARLQLVRVEGFWLCGRAVEMDRALVRAGAAARAELTRARVSEWHGVLAWRGLRLREAQEHLIEAEALYLRGGLLSGVVRTLGHTAGIRGDMGALKEARMVAARRLELACRTDSEDLIARARADLSALLMALGRWREASLELGESGEHPSPWLEIRRAGLDLAAGQPLRALCRLTEGIDATALPPLPRAEALLVLSDAALATGDAHRAEVAAGESVALRVALADRGGECRARVRRAHALLCLGRIAEAVGESRRAADLAQPEARGLGALATVTLGRVTLRRSAEDATSVFQAALAAAAGRPDVASAAAIGVAAATKVSGWREEVDRRVEDLREWGDERLLALVAHDLKRTAPRPTSIPGTQTVEPMDGAFLAAARALQASGSSDTRWAHGVLQLRSILPWRTVWLVGPATNLEVGSDVPGPRTIEGDSLGARIVRDGASPRVVPFVEGAAGGSRFVVAPLGPEVAACFELAAQESVPIPDDLALSLVLAFCGMAVGLAPELLGIGRAPVVPAPGPRTSLVGRSSAMRTLVEEIGRVAPTDLTVHILGETGTGKERVARALHELSDRSSGPFVAVNVACLNDELFESEMFGHVKGAFTHAVADRPGLVSRAETGTLFLDEVADLSPRAQVKLLRFLQEREYERVGEGRLRKANVRVITASNVDLSERVAQGRLRQDLFFRLDRWRLRVPPVRERQGDIRLLVDHFLRLGGRPQTGPTSRFSPQALARLEAYPWPGNVRELESVVEKLAVLSNGNPIGPDEVGRVLPAGPPRTKTESRGLHAAVRDFEREMVRDTLDRHRGHRARSASFLGISRQALSVKMRHLGL